MDVLICVRSKYVKRTAKCEKYKNCASTNNNTHTVQNYLYHTCILKHKYNILLKMSRDNVDHKVSSEFMVGLIPNIRVVNNVFIPLFCYLLGDFVLTKHRAVVNFNMKM